MNGKIHKMKQNKINKTNLHSGLIIGIILLIISTSIFTWYIPHKDSQINHNQKELIVRYDYQTTMHIYQSLKHSTIQRTLILNETEKDISNDTINQLNKEIEGVEYWENHYNELFLYGGSPNSTHINTIESENIKIMDDKAKLQTLGAIFQILGFIFITIFSNKKE